MQEWLSVRRERVARELGLSNEILLIAAGEPLPLPENSDQCYPFIPHAEYAYLSTNTNPGGLVLHDPQALGADRWIDFVPEVSEGERVWEGRQQSPGRLLKEFDQWMKARQGRPILNLGARLPSVTAPEGPLMKARAQLTHARRPKDGHEIGLMRSAVQATQAGFAKAAAFIAEGVSERQIQIELEAEYFRHGADQCGFGTIVGTGPNSAVLHFSPSERKARTGEFVLIDSGAQVGRYTADVTRTFVTGGKASAFQADLYQAVLQGQLKAIERCVAGREWKDIHLSCAIDMTASLVAMGIFRGNPESLVEQEAHALFFPHGLGHMVGLGVRDASGLALGRVKDPRPCLRSLRMDLPLEKDYLVTVEPGLYFIPAILKDPARRSRYQHHVNWELVDQHLGVGGVRIEDDVLVTSGAPIVLTAGIPK